MCIFLRYFVFLYIFLCTFLHFLLPPIVEVDISDIVIISGITNMVKPIIGTRNKQESSKNLSYCPIHRFLESVPLLRWQALKMRAATRPDATVGFKDEGPNFVHRI